ncbi:hypothetical protein [Aquipuribacter sp. MA13-6]|uniref:hypothetical protein n=1 Tax=unclassified Aquipuribacter TaxID=2635084 RepID=UPI003EEC4CE7
MGTPSDWVSGERVFAPPSGTFDVDWLVPAVVEAVPGTSPADARAALLRAWQAQQEPDAPDGPEATDPLRLAAARVVEEARRTFRT